MRPKTSRRIDVKPWLFVNTTLSSRMILSGGVFLWDETHLWCLMEEGISNLLMLSRACVSIASSINLATKVLMV